MYSKNNYDRHPSKREYFDVPVNYVHKGFLFSPKYKMPLVFYDNGPSHYNVRMDMPKTKTKTNYPYRRYSPKRRRI